MFSPFLSLSSALPVLPLAKSLISLPLSFFLSFSSHSFLMYSLFYNYHFFLILTFFLSLSLIHLQILPPRFAFFLPSIFFLPSSLFSFLISLPTSRFLPLPSPQLRPLLPLLNAQQFVFKSEVREGGGGHNGGSTRAQKASEESVHIPLINRTYSGSYLHVKCSAYYSS